jgi:dimethylargininase
MIANNAYQFSHALTRTPAKSVVDGLRAGDGPNPDFGLFKHQHDAYQRALGEAGLTVTCLDEAPDFPDSVFVEDPALCIAGTAIVLHPGAASRFGEAGRLLADGAAYFDDTIDLRAQLAEGGSIDGGDILVTGREVLVGLSARTNQAGFDALARVLAEFNVTGRPLATPADILHFKSDCGLLDAETIFCTERLAKSDCFQGYRILTTPIEDEPAANLIRVNDWVFLAQDYPRSAELLDDHGYQVKLLDISEAAKIDGGLSCMSLRYHRQ